MRYPIQIDTPDDQTLALALQADLEIVAVFLHDPFVHRMGSTNEW